MGFASAFQAGFGTVSSAMKARQERELKQRIGQESERYGITEGAYGQGLQQNIDQLQSFAQQERGLSGEAAQQRARAEYEPSIAALQGRPEYAQNLEQVLRLQEDAGYRAANQTGLPAGPYEQAIRELERRRDMQAPDYTIASRSMRPEDTFATREAAEMAAKPMRTQGLARVYREAGEIEKADELLERADQQELRALQREAAGLTLKKGRREAQELENQDNFQAFAAENPNATTQQLKDAAFKQFKFSPKQWQDAVNTRLGIKENEQKEFVLNVKDKLKGKTSLSQYAELYNTDPDFDDKTDLAIVPGKNGAVTLNFVDKATGRVTGSETFNSQAKAIEYLNKQATEPETIGTWMLNLRSKEAATAASERSNRPGPGTPSLSQKLADAEKAFGRKFTEAEKSVFLGLTSRPGLGGDKPVEVQEAGIRVMVNGQLRVTDGEGGYVALGGVVPAERAAFLQQAGVPDNLIGQIDWSPDGRTVGFGGKQYDPRNPRDIRELNDDYERLGVNTNRVIEAQRNTPQRGLGAQPDQSGMPLYFAP
jgi:hypothetical protein